MEKFSMFERRMEILYILMNQKIVSCLELARRFSVSSNTIGSDITELSRIAPIASKMGRYGGVYIIDEYKREKVYLTRDEESVIEKIIPTLKGKDKELLHMVLYKFALPENNKSTKL